MTKPERPQVTIGFDLDMTLADTRECIRDCLEEVSRGLKKEFDIDAIVARLGPPIQRDFARIFTPADAATALEIFRTHMGQEAAMEKVSLMPGSVDSLEVVRNMGGRTVVLTTKHAPLAHKTLERIGLAGLVDEVQGDLRGPDAKGGALRALGAYCYVGDYIDDMKAAQHADALGVGVLSGGCLAEELRQAGADVILHSLVAFPHWLPGSVAMAGLPRA